jgi:serine/threonine-protein kinase
VSALSDAALARLRELVERPELAGDGDAGGDASRYELLDRIGEGGMGAVYRARDRALGREVALKVLRAPAPSDEERRRLLREARVLAGLEHPGIVPVHDVGTLADGRPFYVMKRVRGERLDAWARGGGAGGGAPARAELLRVFRQVCDAVAFAHAAGVVHRDLKPQNVMLGAFGEVLVLDWGVAKLWGEAADASGTAAPAAPAAAPRPGDPDTATGTVLGTPGYMAPEQRVGASAAADARADVYGLGGILLFLLTGAHPDPDRDPRADDVPAPLRAICRRARAAAPGDRYPSASALAADVANWQDALPVSAHREGPVERARRVLARHRTAALLVLGYLLMRVALLAFGGR